MGDRAETDRLTIKDSDLKCVGIDKIYNIGVVFRVYNHDDWDDVTTNEMIINFNEKQDPDWFPVGAFFKRREEPCSPLGKSKKY